ncbi:MAG TPA: PepSY domain-containing protein [Nocardioides sp.]|jgi:uncharacterized membrane protein YkoI|nr:PepSY domain-containing protein [Nocardioides sp.]
MRTRIIVGGVALGAAVAATAGGIAVAGSGDDGPASHQYTEQQAQQARQAALEATGGGTVNSVESDTENGATYEVEVTQPDGTTVDVRLDDRFRVVVIEGDGE